MTEKAAALLQEIKRRYEEDAADPDLRFGAESFHDLCAHEIVAAAELITSGLITAEDGVECIALKLKT